MKRLVWTAALVAVMPGMAMADIVTTYTFNLEESQTVPRSGGTGTGSCTVVLNETASTADVSCSYSNMTSNVIAAHIHGPASPGQPAVVEVPLTESGGTAGTIQDLGLALSAQQVQDMRNGLQYVNVHSVNHGGGEIRGQIVNGVTIPTISQWGLILLAVLLVTAGGAMIRRRQAGMA